MYELIKFFLLLMFICRAVYTDVKSSKVENRMLLIAAVFGVIFTMVTEGYDQMLYGVKEALVVTLILFLLFLVKAMGAGDIKLLAVVSIYFPRESIRITIGAFLAAGIWAVLRMIIRAVKKEKIYIAGETIHFTIPVMAAFLIVEGIRLTGLL